MTYFQDQYRTTYFTLETCVARIVQTIKGEAIAQSVEDFAEEIARLEARLEKLDPETEADLFEHHGILCQKSIFGLPWYTQRVEFLQSEYSKTALKLSGVDFKALAAFQAEKHFFTLQDIYEMEVVIFI